MSGTGPPNKGNEEKVDPFAKKEDLFTPTGEIAGGYDLGMARAYALEHAKKTIGESVGRGRESRPLIWEIEKAGWDEDAECWEVVLTAQPARAQVQQKGTWLYHVRPMGGLLPGTPLLRQELLYTLPRARRRGRLFLALAVLVVLALGGGGGLLLAGGFPRATRPAPPPAVVPPPPTSTPTPFPTPTLEPTPTPRTLPTPTPSLLPTPTPTAMPAPTPRPSPTSTPTLPPPSTPTPKPTPTPTTAPAGPKYGGVLNTALVSLPTDWEPMKAVPTDLRKIHNLVFSQLITMVPSPGSPCQMELARDLAESWEISADGLRVTVRIRKGVRFHNGRELTAEDAVFSLTRLLNQPTTSGMSVVKDRVMALQAVDNYTVMLRTDQPTPALFSRLLSSPYGAVILAKESGGVSQSWAKPESYMGSGPFMFREYRPGTDVTFERWPNYWKPGAPYLDRLRFLLMPDKAIRLAALRGAMIDMLTDGVTGAEAKQLAGVVPGLQAQSCPAWAYPGHLVMRTDKAPFSDSRVRRAISMAIDRKAILKDVLGGEGVPVGLYPPVHPFFLEAALFPPEVRKYLEYDPALAKLLLVEAGYPAGLAATIVAYARYPSPYPEMVKSISELLSAVGIKATVQLVDPAVFTQTALNGNFESMTFTMAVPDEPYYLARASSKAPFSVNRGHVNDPELDRLIGAFYTTFDFAKAKELARQIQIRLVDQAYDITTPAMLDYALLQPWVKGFVKTADERFTGVWAQGVWLDK